MEHPLRLRVEGATLGAFTMLTLGADPLDINQEAAIAQLIRFCEDARLLVQGNDAGMKALNDLNDCLDAETNIKSMIQVMRSEAKLIAPHDVSLIRAFSTANAVNPAIAV